ncbi:hypothetical protein [Desulfococcus sp.]|uniref:hypothetical protein n=1 Tax=Desulfococcus sp. TaxID=2025834 RepID=UPI003593597E
MKGLVLTIAAAAVVAVLIWKRMRTAAIGPNALLLLRAYQSIGATSPEPLPDVITETPK